MSHTVNGAPANTRYVVDDGTQIAATYSLPIDLCFKSHGILQQAKWLRYECNGDGSEVYRKAWDATTSSNPETDCQANAGGQITATFTSNADACGVGTFECNGLNSYALINTYLNDPTCEVPQLSIPMVPGCFCDTTYGLGSSFQTSCTDASTGTFHVYNDTATCNTVPITTQTLGVCSVVSQHMGADIQSKMTECVLNVDRFTPLPTVQPTTAQPTEQPTPRPTYAPNTFTFNPKYVMDNDAEPGITYPFAIDICFQSYAFPSSRWTRYQCSSDGSSVDRTIWDDTISSTPQSDCERNVGGTITATFTGSTPSCGVGNFECNGDNTYALASVYINDAACAGSPVIDLPIALGCFCDTDTASIQTWCQDDWTGALSTYNTTSLCDGNPLQTHDLSVCSVMGERLGLPIQFKMTQCALNATLAPTQTAMPTTPPSTAQPTKPPTLRPSIPPNAMGSNPKYVMDDDNEHESTFPLPIDVCFQTYGIAGSLSLKHQWSRYECNADGTQVARRIWDDTVSATPQTDCQSNTGGVITATFTGDTATSCGVGNFECNGVTNYVMIDFYFNTATCTVPPVSVPIVIGCFCDTDSTSIEAWCGDGQTGVLNTYNGTNMCDNIAVDTTDLGVCSVYTTVLGSIDIQSKISECVLNGESHTTEPTPGIPTAVTYEPSNSPTKTPTKRPSGSPSNSPTERPSGSPSGSPTTKPSETPTAAPSKEITTAEPENTVVDVFGSGSSTRSPNIVLMLTMLIIIVNVVKY